MSLASSARGGGGNGRRVLPVVRQGLHTPSVVTPSAREDARPRPSTPTHVHLDAFERRLSGLAKAGALTQRPNPSVATAPRPNTTPRARFDPALTTSWHDGRGFLGTAAQPAAKGKRHGPAEVASALAARKEPCPPQRVNFLLRAHDRDRDGFLEDDELQSLLDATMQQLPRQLPARR